MNSGFIHALQQSAKHEESSQGIVSNLSTNEREMGETGLVNVLVQRASRCANDMGVW